MRRDSAKHLAWAAPVALALVLSALVLGACDRGESTADPAPAPSQPQPVAQPDPTKGAPTPIQDLAKGVKQAVEGQPAKATKVPFEEKVKTSIPIAATPEPQTLAGKTVSAVRCAIEGHELVGPSGSSVIGRIELGTDGMLYVVDESNKVRRFSLAETDDSCTLTLDTSFGEGGVLDPGGRIKELAAIKGDVVIASGGIGRSYRLTKGQVDLTCQESRAGYVVASPDGRSFLGHFVNPPLRKVGYTADGCTVEDWALEMPLKLINQVGFVGGNILVGGVMAEKVNNREPRIVVAFTKSGQEAYRFGNTEKVTGDDVFGWVHAIEECGKAICVVDSNYRRLSMWKRGGEHIGSVSLSKLFGVDYPWIGDIEIAPRNKAFFPVAQQREAQGGEKRSGVYEGMIFRTVWGG